MQILRRLLLASLSLLTTTVGALETLEFRLIRLIRGTLLATLVTVRNQR